MHQQSLCLNILICGITDTVKLVINWLYISDFACTRIGVDRIQLNQGKYPQSSSPLFLRFWCAPALREAGIYGIDNIQVVEVIMSLGIMQVSWRVGPSSCWVHVGYANSSSCLQVETNRVEMERRSPVPKVVSSAFCSHAFLETFGSADQHSCFLAFVCGSCGSENLCRMSPRSIWWERFRLDGLANVSDHAEETMATYFRCFFAIVSVHFHSHPIDIEHWRNRLLWKLCA